MTAGSLIASALRLVGVLAAGEDPAAEDSNDALVTLNDLIDSWSNENLLIPNKVSETFALTANQQTYTMGSGGDFDTTRPVSIENALLQVTNVSPVLELPMAILNQDQFANISLKTLTSNYPSSIYNDQAYPLNNIKFWPVPESSGYNVVLYSWKPLSQVATLATSFSLPPGYTRALRFNLAVDLSGEYGKTLPDTVTAIAIQAKAAIKRTNVRPYYLRVDSAIQARPAVWNWLTGEPVQ